MVYFLLLFQYFLQESVLCMFDSFILYSTLQVTDKSRGKCWTQHGLCQVLEDAEKCHVKFSKD